jgi:tetratricopeptide (TPR) repeat protein
MPFALILAATLCAQPPSIDDLLTTARAGFQRGDYAAAQSTLEQAWSSASSLPDDDARNYDILKLLSRTQTAARQYDAAESSLQLAIHWSETHRGRDNATVDADYIDLALLCRARNDPQRGLGILNFVLTNITRRNGVESLPVAEIHGYRAALQLAANQPQPASESLRMALRLREAVVGPDHPTLLPDLDHLASVSLTLRDYQAAELANRRALRIRERLFGPMDPNLLANLEGLAYALFGQKKFEEAEQVYLRLLALWKASAGEYHPMVALTLDKLVVFYREWGKPELMEARAGQAAALRVHFHAASLVQRASDLLAAGQPAEAEALLREAQSLLHPPHALLEPLQKEIESLLADIAKAAPPKP